MQEFHSKQGTQPSLQDLTYSTAWDGLLHEHMLCQTNCSIKSRVNHEIQTKLRWKSEKKRSLSHLLLQKSCGAYFQTANFSPLHIKMTLYFLHSYTT